MDNFKALLMIILLMGLLENIVADVNHGLLAYYPFNANAQDHSGSGNHGTPYGVTLTQDRFDTMDSAYHFNGNGNSTDSIQLPHTIIDGLVNITSSVWIKTTEGNQAILDGANGTNTNEYLIYMGGRGDIGAYIKNNYFYIGKVNDGQWHHIVMVRDGSSGFVQVFIDSILANAEYLPAGILSIALNGLWLGRDQRCVGGCFNTASDFLGSIDDLRIYNRILSSAEVLKLYQEGHNYSWIPDTQTVEYCKNYPKECGMKPQTIIIPF